jgi:crossover junction endodeoxyribonuclease RusA
MNIKLPWPPAKSSPNGSQGDWRGKASAGKAYKNACLLECIAQKVPRNIGSVSCITLTFHPPKNYRFDLDNMLARFKRGGDAIADHIGVDDADWQEMRLKRGEKVKGGCVVVEIDKGQPES